MIQVLLLVILIGLNAFFAASEIAFISLNDAKIDIQAKEGNKKAKKAKKNFLPRSQLLIAHVVSRLYTTNISVVY